MNKVTNIKLTILSFDLGFSNLGYCVLVSDGVIKNYLFFNCFFTSQLENMTDRIEKIYTFVNYQIMKHSPNLIVLEKVFHNTNTKTFTIINKIHGIILLAIKLNKKKYLELTPIQIKIINFKISNINKKDIKIYLINLFNIKEEEINHRSKTDDAFDALAIANAATIYFLI